MTNDITMPDFDKLAYNLIHETPFYDVRILLRELFEQGRSLGHREGFKKGDEEGWIYAMESNYYNKPKC